MRHVLQQVIIQAEEFRDCQILPRRVARGVVSPGFQHQPRQAVQLFVRDWDAERIAVIQDAR